MNDKELLEKAFMAYQREIQSRSNLDYKINSEQWAKLLRARDFLSRHCDDVEDISIRPSTTVGGITAYTTLLFLNGEEIQEFADIIGSSSALSIDATIDGDVCVSFTIPDIFVKK